MWWVALLLAGGVLVLVELGGRELGFRPQVKDSPELWSWIRTQASQGGERAVVLLGSSRFQTGLVPEELSKVLGGVPVLELAINGSSSLPVLEDLAADEHFRGRVLCEVSPTMFFSVGPSEARTKPAGYVAHYRHRTLVSNWETRLRVPLQERLVVLHSALHPKSFVHHLLLHRSAPRPSAGSMLPDRSFRTGFEGVDLEQARARWANVFRTQHGNTPEPQELQALLERVASAVERIRSRGGDVIFVRMVTSGAVRHIEDERYPRALYWDPLIQRTGKGLTFEDVPALERLPSPDDSHLGYAAALEFTRVLARETLLSEAPSTFAQDTP